MPSPVVVVLISSQFRDDEWPLLSARIVATFTNFAHRSYFGVGRQTSEFEGAILNLSAPFPDANLTSKRLRTSGNKNPWNRDVNGCVREVSVGRNSRLDGAFVVLQHQIDECLAGLRRLFLVVRQPHFCRRIRCVERAVNDVFDLQGLEG